jgi:hypothetical protein
MYDDYRVLGGLNLGAAVFVLIVLSLIFCWIVMSPSTSRICRLIRGSGWSQSMATTPKLSPQFIVAMRWRFVSKGRQVLDA